MIVIIYDDLAFSFTKVARLLKKGLEMIGYRNIAMVSSHTVISIPRSAKGIVIGDTAWFAISKEHMRFVKSFDKLVLWTDSPVDPEWIAQHYGYEDVCHYVCLRAWCNEYRKRGIRCDGWVPRMVDVEVVKQVISIDRCELCKDLWNRYGRYILTVGSDHQFGQSRPPRKGIDAYDTACGVLKTRYNIRCLYVGSNKVRNAHQVTHHGGLSEFELLRLMRCAEVFVWASRSEGFGMPPMEAMAVGTIVVASNAPFNEHIYGIKFDYTNVVKSYCPAVQMPYVLWDYTLDNLVEAIEYALDLPPDDKEEMRSRAMQYASKFFASDIIAEAIVRL